MTCLWILCMLTCLTLAWLNVFESVLAQSATTTAKNPSPELVGQLTKELSITPAQATGGAGALFGVAKSDLNPADFSKIAAVVPCMSGFLKAAPAVLTKFVQSKGGASLASLLSGSLR